MFSGSLRESSASSNPSPERGSDAVDDLLDLNSADSLYGSYSAGNTPEPGSTSTLDLSRDTLLPKGCCSEGTTPEPGYMPSWQGGMAGNSGAFGNSFSGLASPEPGMRGNSLGPIGSGSLYSPSSLRFPSPTAMVGGQQNGDIGDVVTQITTNLRKLADLIEKNASSTSPTASPSPQPTTPSFPDSLGGGFLLNDVALKNLQNLAQIAACEPDRFMGLPTIPSPTPIDSTGNTPTPPVGFPAREGKVNIMQIRCKFGQLGSGKGQFSSPHGFCCGVDEEIVIADTNNHRICVYDKSGEFKSAFGTPGKDEGQLWYPRKVAFIRHSASGNALASPRYVICDRGSERSRMQIFTRSGHFVRKIAIRYIDIVAGLAITPTGNIVAVDSVSPTVFVIAETGDLLRWFDCSEYMREPSDVAVANNEYYICDFKGHCVVVFSEEGQYLRRIGYENLTNFPNGIDVSDAGDILIGDSHGNRFHVVVFDKDGKLLGEFECPYVKVSRCCGLKITSEGYVVTLAKNNHHVLVLNTLYIM